MREIGPIARFVSNFHDSLPGAAPTPCFVSGERANEFDLNYSVGIIDSRISDKLPPRTELAICSVERDGRLHGRAACFRARRRGRSSSGGHGVRRLLRAIFFPLYWEITKRSSSEVVSCCAAVGSRTFRVFANLLGVFKLSVKSVVKLLLGQSGS